MVVTAVTLGVVLVVLWVIYTRLEAEGQLDGAKWEPFLTSNLWVNFIWPGVKGTLTAAAVSIVLALAFGIILGVGRLSHTAPIRWVCGVIVEFFRAVPVLVLMIWAYFAYAQPPLNEFIPSEHLALAAVVTGLTLYNSAVIAEIVRAGIRSIPRGEVDAARSIGLSYLKTMRLVVLPQAISRMMPAIVSQCVTLVKDTSLASIAAVSELVGYARSSWVFYGNVAETLFVVACIYFVINYTLSRIARRLELRQPRESGPRQKPATIDTHVPSA
jgi:glutamate transport system permease protein